MYIFCIFVFWWYSSKYLASVRYLSSQYAVVNCRFALPSEWIQVKKNPKPQLGLWISKLIWKDCLVCSFLVLRLLQNVIPAQEWHCLIHLILYLSWGVYRNSKMSQNSKDKFSKVQLSMIFFFTLLLLCSDLQCHWRIGTSYWSSLIPSLWVISLKSALLWAENWTKGLSEVSSVPYHLNYSVVLWLCALLRQWDPFIL